MKPKILAIIPARSGSKGIPRKNIKILCGKPLIAYTIEAALSSKLVDRVIVSTEDEEIIRIARAYGAEVIMRPLKLAQDDTPSLPVFQQVIKHLAEVENCHPDIIVIRRSTSPLRTVDDIDGAMDKFLHTDYDSVVSLCEVECPPHWMFTLEGDKLKPVIESGEKIMRRQDAPKVYRSKALYALFCNLRKTNYVINKSFNNKSTN